MSAPKVIDLSHYQASVDFNAAKASGVLAAILKCSEGTTIVDPSFAAHRGHALAAGLGVASYHYLHPGGAGAQMQFYLQTLKPQPGERVVIDYEQDGCTLDDLHQAVQAIMDTDASLQITVYSGHLAKDQLGNNPDAFLSQNTSLWIAQYTSAPSPSWPKAVWPTWSLWQYTDQATIGGYNGSVDGDRFNGSDAQLLKWIGPAAGPGPTPADIPEVAVTMSASAPVKVALSAGANVSIVGAVSAAAKPAGKKRKRR